MRNMVFVTFLYRYLYLDYAGVTVTTPPFQHNSPLELTDNTPLWPDCVSLILIPPYPTKLIGNPASLIVDI